MRQGRESRLFKITYRRLFVALHRLQDLGAVHADGVVSSQVVGYTTDAMTGGKFNMNGMVFSNVDGSDIDLNDMTFPNITGSDYLETSDQILVWNPGTSGYTTYWYYYEAGAAAEEIGWYGLLDEPTTLPAGTAFWYLAKPGDGKKITFKKTY